MIGMIHSIGFSDPQRLYLIIPLLLLLIAGFFLKWYLSRKFDLFFEGEGVHTLNLSFRRAWVKGGLLSCAFGLMVLATAGPVSRMKVKTYNFMALVDISQSMWCEDYSRGNSHQSRLELAKENLLSLVDELSDQSRFGLGVFAGSADSTFILVPPQELEGARGDLKTMIQSIQYSWTWKDGSSVKDPLIQMTKILEEKGASYGTGLTLIFLTDGEETFPNWSRAVEPEKFRGVHLYFFGMGTVEGAPVPEFEEGWRFKGFKKNYQGVPIVSRLEEANLLELARTFNGSYLRIQSGSDLKALAKNQALKVGERESSFEVNRVFWGVSFILVAFFLIL